MDKTLLGMLDEAAIAVRSRTAVGVCMVAGMLLLVGSPIASAQNSNDLQLVGDSPFDMNALLDPVYEAVVQQLGVSLDEPVRILVSPPDVGQCRSRGATMLRPMGPDGALGTPMILVRANPETSVEQVSAVLAHELGHVLLGLTIEGGEAIHSIFVEGFATWAAGHYWLEWQGETSFQSAVASYIAAGDYLPLHQNDGFLDTLSESAEARFGDDCLRKRDIIYGEWAAFIEYLVDEYGRETLYSLIRTPVLVIDDGGKQFQKPDFPAVYGRSLAQLEASWLEMIAADD